MSSTSNAELVLLDGTFAFTYRYRKNLPLVRLQERADLDYVSQPYDTTLYTVHMTVWSLFKNGFDKIVTQPSI